MLVELLFFPLLVLQSSSGPGVCDAARKGNAAVTSATNSVSIGAAGEETRIWTSWC
jgi:hypothetical protein